MAAISRVLPWFRQVTGEKINELIDAVNNLTGFGTSGAVSATSVVMTSVTQYSGTAVTRAAARAAAPSAAPIGSPLIAGFFVFSASRVGERRGAWPAPSVRRSSSRRR